MPLTARTAASSTSGRTASERLQWQSWMVTTVCTVAGLLTAASIFLFSLNGGHVLYVWGTLVVALLFALLARFLKAATWDGALAGALVCYNLTAWTRNQQASLFRSGITPLFLLFVLTWAATRIRRRQKEAAGLAEGRKGRVASQVFANLGVASLVVGSYGAYFAAQVLHFTFPFSYFACLAAALAALAEATADTVSSEIGQVFGGRPILVTTLQRVAPGTDGAISLAGTAAGVLTAILVGLTGWWALSLNLQFTAIAVGAGVAGFFADTLIGATLERWGWFGNDMVNFISTLVAAMTAIMICRWITNGIAG